MQVAFPKPPIVLCRIARISSPALNLVREMQWSAWSAKNDG